MITGRRDAFNFGDLQEPVDGETEGGGYEDIEKNLLEFDEGGGERRPCCGAGLDGGGWVEVCAAIVS